MSTDNFETRLAALEEEVARLKKAIASGKGVPWWEEWAGAFRKDPYFAKAMKYGREYRESLRPKAGKARKRKHGDDAP